MFALISATFPTPANKFLLDTLIRVGEVIVPPIGDGDTDIFNDDLANASREKFQDFSRYVNSNPEPPSMSRNAGTSVSEFAKEGLIADNADPIRNSLLDTLNESFDPACSSSPVSIFLTVRGRSFVFIKCRQQIFYNSILKRLVLLVRVGQHTCALAV